MPDLQQDAIPHEQHFLDIPRHLAIITSAVVRHSRNVTPQDPAVSDLFKRCRDVERYALYYVSRHATPRGGGGGGGASTSRSHTSESAGGLPIVISNHDPFESLSPHGSRLSSSSRPKTAPTAAMSDPALHTRVGYRLSQELPTIELDGPSETGAETAKAKEDDSWAALRRQASRPRSVSTDSVPDFRRNVSGSGGFKSVVEAMRPERKKGFLRNILNRK